MRSVLILLSIVPLLACGPRLPIAQTVGDAASGKDTAKEVRHSESPSFRTLKIGVPLPSAFDTIVATLAEQKIATELVSKDGGVIRTAWTDGMRYEIRLLGSVCTMQGESKAGGRKLAEPELSAMSRVAAALEVALHSATAEVAARATATPTPAAATPMEAARRAVEACGLRIEQTNEATGRIETSWNASEFAAINISDVNINYRVRYIVQVTGRIASARAETEKTTDQRSWVPRTKTTKKEEEQLERLRRALVEQMAALH